MDISCRMQRAAEDGTDLGAPWSYSGLRNSGTARRYPIWCQNNFALSLDLGEGHPLPMTRRTRPFAPLPARRFSHSRVWGRVNSKNFTLTDLTCWIDGIWVEGRGVATACHQDYFWANRGLGNAGEVRGRTKALFDRVAQFRHHGPYTD